MTKKLILKIVISLICVAALGVAAYYFFSNKATINSHDDEVLTACYDLLIDNYIEKDETVAIHFDGMNIYEKEKLIARIKKTAAERGANVLFDDWDTLKKKGYFKPMKDDDSDIVYFAGKGIITIGSPKIIDQNKIEVYSSFWSYSLGGNGWEYILEKQPDGKWEITDMKLNWISQNKCNRNIL